MFLRVLFLLVCFFPGLCYAQEENAVTAARNVLQALAAQKYVLVWDTMISEWAHAHWSKDTFLSQMSMGRPMLGMLGQSIVVSQDHTTRDPTTGFNGDIYAITFKNSYSSGLFYEKIVVSKDPDGVYRLSGMFGSPVPK